MMDHGSDQFDGSDLRRLLLVNTVWPGSFYQQV